MTSARPRRPPGMTDAVPAHSLVVSVGAPPTLDDVDALARTCLGLRRLGGRVRVVAAPPVLELLALAGLGDDVELVPSELRCVAAVELRR